jgi:hypothetical protein
MNACRKRVATLIAAIILTACNDGLIYSEWTSINLASARINADPATPVAIKLGFDRNVVAVAPPIGGTAEQTSSTTVEGGELPGTTVASAEDTAATTDGCESPAASSGEAVSEFSTFSVNVSTPFVQTTDGTPDWRHTWIHSRFASGGAALAIACEPDVVAAVMGLTVPTTEELAAQILSELNTNDRAALCAIAVNAFDNLTADQRTEAGRLTGVPGNYDATLHAQLQQKCAA